MLRIDSSLTCVLIDGHSLGEPQNTSFIDELPNELLLAVFSCGA